MESTQIRMLLHTPSCPASTSLRGRPQKTQIEEFLERERAARFRRLQMKGDEDLARVSMDARAKIADLFKDGTISGWGACGSHRPRADD